jgi:hypothetical protein
MNDIEAKLKQLQPNAGALDRDQLLYSAAFAAGKIAGRKPWRIGSAFLFAALVAVCLWSVFNPKLMPLPANAAKEAESIPPATPERTEPYKPEPTSYIALMQHLGDDTASANYPDPALPPPPLTPHSRID